VQRNRRRTIVPDEILAQGNRTVTNGNTPQVPKPSNEQLSCLYNNCVKLLNENVNLFTRLITFTLLHQEVVKF